MTVDHLDDMRVRDRLAQVELDLEELEDQLRAGEMDDTTAARLREIYETERSVLQARLADDEPTPSGRSRLRMLAGAVFLMGGAVVVALLAVNAAEDRLPGGSATGGIVGDVVAGRTGDLSDVSDEEMEAVVARYPDVVGMRVALARRYFEAGDFDKAFDHYMAVLDRDQHPEALANVGWMTYLTGRPDLAEPFVSRALAISPDYPQAEWYLANILFDGLGDAAAALGPLQSLLERDDLPDDIREAALALLARVEVAAQ